MGRVIRLTENEFHSLVKRLVKETKYQYDEDLIEDEDKMTKEDPETIDIIANFFKTHVFPSISTKDKSELSRMAKKLGREINEHYLNEDLKSRFKNFKEKTMIGGGISAAVTGIIGFTSQISGWSKSEIMTGLHEYFQSFGYDQYTGPLSVAMIAAGLVVALKGYSDRANRLDTPYTKDKPGNGFNSY